MEAKDGLEAIQRVREEQPDLVILDLCMPVLNGLETAAALHGALPKLPIILDTLHKDIVSGIRVRSFGICAVLSKTGHVEVLVGEILKHAGVAKAVSA